MGFKKESIRSSFTRVEASGVEIYLSPMVDHTLDKEVLIRLEKLFFVKKLEIEGLDIVVES